MPHPFGAIIEMTSKTITKKLNIPLLLSFMLVGWLVNIATIQPANAWRFDARQYEASAHGVLSCMDCHHDVRMHQHPDPERVNRQPHESFDPNACYSCHANVQNDYETGTHAGIDITDRSIHEQCIACHDPHAVGITAAMEPPIPDVPDTLSSEDGACMACHHDPGPAQTPAAIQRTHDLCMHCHAAAQGIAQVKQLDLQTYRITPHADMDCMACHVNADAYPHDQQQQSDCLTCHQRHRESVAHDAHLTVSCEACHLEDVRPLKPAGSDRILWERTTEPGQISNVHAMGFDKENDCSRCHVPGNQLGAAAMVLPPKSVACMPCHAATLTASDTVSIISLTIFMVGLFLVLGLYFTASLPGRESQSGLGKFFILIGAALKTLFSWRIIPVARAIFWDVLLQERLRKRSHKRWVIHGLIFFPILVRFLYGLAALAGTAFFADNDIFWSMVDKNHPVTAFLFDLTGICILAGVVLAWRRGSLANQTKPDGLPRQDKPALALLAAIVVAGFLTEGIRISLTGMPEGTGFAPIGYGIALFFSAFDDLSTVYGYFWYLHAILWGAFLIYLPFSNMLHIIMGPVILAINAAREKH
jgi:nitrate reductase gamma subunit